MRFQVKYEQDGEVRYNYHTIPFVRSSSRSNWGFSSINAWQHVSTEYEPEIAPYVEMNSIEIVRSGGEEQRDIYIDNVWIGKNPLAGKVF